VAAPLFAVQIGVELQEKIVVLLSSGVVGIFSQVFSVEVADRASVLAVDPGVDAKA